MRLNRISAKLGLAAAGLLAMLGSAGCLLFGAAGNPAGGPREIRLVARNMTFYLQGDNAPNPTLRLRAGEQVRLVLANEEPGIDHDFAIRPWKVGTGILNGKGEDTVTFTVPAAPGSETTYMCTPHFGMMRGTILVE